LPAEENIKQKIAELIERSKKLKVGDKEFNESLTAEQVQECSGWMASALNIVQIVCPSLGNAYRKRAEQIADKKTRWSINGDVGEFGHLLSELLDAIEYGLLATVADKARAETFDNFLDHAKNYLKENQKNEAGVISGVVFEDSLRRVCRKYGKNDKDEKIDNLISYLTKNDFISQTKAKRARVAAHVRTKATHAQWGEFDINDVQVTIDFTEELILAHLDR
jgi:hypothetical protein